MSGKKKFFAGLIIAVLLIVVAAGVVWHITHYVMVDFKFYAKDADYLDLRGQQISTSHYDKIRSKLPQCRILWDIPFQGAAYPDDTRELTVTSLTVEDVAALDYFEALETVQAEQCTDYAQLLSLQERRPEVTVNYFVTLGGTSYAHTADEITVNRIAREEIELLHCLAELTTVVAGGGEDMANMTELQAYCHDNGLAFYIAVGGERVSDSAESVTIQNATDGELNLISLLTNLKQLHMKNPQASAENVLALRETYPTVEVSWEQEIGGLTFQDTDTVVDLSAVVIDDLAEVEAGMARLPNAETVILGLCGIDNPEWGTSRTQNLAVCKIENEDLAAYRDRVRADYKVVWTVRLGPSIALRTDADNFMPNHYGVGRLFDDYAYNLRYCEDMICLDVGHMTLTDISFVTYMPHLKYLILAWTEVQYIEPIRSCKELVFLELDNSCIRDYSPVADCTALEDLNIGNTFCDITPILKMTWLKNLYMIFGSSGSAYQASQALPDTHVVATGNATVGSGWRRLPNYYAMRDCLGVPYMN